MTPRFRFSLRLGFGILMLPWGLSAARVTSDLQPPQKRQATVDTARRLAQGTTPKAIPDELVSPFNPADFDRPEGTGSPAKVANQGPVASTTLPPPPPPGDREILETLAAQLTPTGMIQKGNSPLLVMGSRNFEIGTRFTVTYNNQDYELELVAINRTSFTLRYSGEVITRPIKSVR
jgi:hypothetical protein